MSTCDVSGRLCSVISPHVDSRQRIRAATAVVTERLALCRRCD
jgi:hypothetical protein